MNKKLAVPFLIAAALSLMVSADASAQKKKKKKKEDKVEKLEPWEVDTLINPIPINRQMFTGKVEKLVQKADLRDGTADGIIELEDTTVSRIVSEAILKEVPLIIIHIENLPSAQHQTKIQYHRALEGLMRRINNKSLNPDNAAYIRKAIANFEELIIAREENRVMDYVKQNDNIYTLDNSELLNDYPEAKAYVFESVGKAKPEMMIKRLPEFAKESYADPIVAAAARVVPGTILTYATSTSYLSSVVRRNKDPFVQTIVQIASESRSSLKALPFLGDIYNKRKTIAQIDAITENPKEYYKALVGLKLQNETIADKSIDKELNLRGLQFVRVVNELHDSPAPVRFKSLLEFNAEELYFMMIGSQDEIYTSSFTWMFDRMLEQMKPQTGDQLLEKIHKSHFRTFIRMAAGYNKLSPFLGSMEESKKNELMKEFVANLEQGDADDLEDAVDVADAFGSITDPKLVAFLKNEVRENYERKANEKGVIVYGLLYTIFNSAENSESLSDDLDSYIPPITFVPNASLKDEKGNVVQQVFFYGDKDGMGAYNNYINLFKSTKWKIAKNKYWTTITATGTNPVIIYANNPLPEDAQENDEFAQNKLQEYIDENDIHPSVIIHRGHSYYLPTTLKHLTESAKIIVLGSCGGYHNLATVLDASPDAHIISSKQVGALSVNVPIINALNDDLLAGKDVNWVEMWQNLGKYFSGRGAGVNDLFSDYVPPNKNLGAIFIKAYRKMSMHSEN
jgi:hypothetical protein